MYKIIKEALDKKQNYLVVGDLMIDQYILGDVKRISPEAPVPVLKVSSKKNNPGGAGNVAVNISGLNSDVTIIGFAGEDNSLKTLQEGFDKNDIELKASIWNRSTITKTRLISGQQQIVRIDEEESIKPSESEQNIILKSIKSTDFNNYNGIVISDYAKGVCQAGVCQVIILEAKINNIPVIVDPKGLDWEKYRGATVLTPNLKELSDIYGKEILNIDKDISEIGLELLKKYEFENLVVTRSEKGMTLINRQGIEHFPTMAKDVFDVSGAGDTVVSGITRFLTSGLNIKDSINLANFAAGIVVAHVGTWPITKEALLKESKQFKDFSLTIKELKANHRKIVFTNGCFDLLHPGHIDYLNKAKELGDYLIVGLNSDDSVKRLKGESRPVNNQDVRKIMLEGLGCVDRVEFFTEDTPYNLIKSIKPDILVKGGDYSVENIVGREFAKETQTIAFLDGFSTTSLIERIKKAYE